MKKGIALLLISTFAVTALYYFNRDTTKQYSTSVTAADKAVTAKRMLLKQAVKSKTTADKPPLSVTQMTPTREITVDKNAGVEDTSTENNASESLFVESQKAKEFLQASGKLRENLQGEVYIEISSNEIKSLAVGDTFKLEIPALDMFYDIQVDQTREDQFGNQTIEAVLPDEEGKYSSIITVSERSIYGNITTPHGIYAIEGNGQYAWIAETAGLLDGVIQDQIGGGSIDSENHNHAPIDTGNGKRSSTH
ncbi:hypothetical protein [Thalassomonas sp. RHCl1]|uniref:hypothetical protein n=1 Tax=Thalassomonas sp. RHCl1 TaxID=2995320 RepID=UPI00248C71EA|nr:hypothetical protein [Thalassomonas sp. RHCl1]